MNRINFRKLKPELLEKFNNKCVYCGVKLYEPMMADIEHFYPKSIYPHLALDMDNLLIACKACNMLKSNKFPLDGDGNSLLIHPVKENFSDHIIQLKNGYLEGKTEKGQATIDILQLNRSSLIEQRVLDMIDMEFDDTINLSNSEIYSTFKDSLNKIGELNLIDLEGQEDLQNYMKYMLYSNTITALETYLCDRFVSLVNKEDKHLRNFVQTFKDFGEEKFTLNQIFNKYDEIKNKSNKEIKDVIYHNLPKVSGMYRDTFDIQFPVFNEVMKSVNIRHDLVHRNGKTKDGNFHIVDKNLIDEVVNNCIKFVDLLEEELNQLD